jgi:hypothetical protein
MLVLSVAGIAQLVERELPKLEVASSSLVARSSVLPDALRAVRRTPYLTGEKVVLGRREKWA